MTGRNSDKRVSSKHQFASVLWKSYYIAVYGFGDGSVTWWTLQPIERSYWIETAEILTNLGFGQIERGGI